jgi:hypothetical protein
VAGDRAQCLEDFLPADDGNGVDEGLDHVYHPGRNFAQK